MCSIPTSAPADSGRPRPSTYGPLLARSGLLSQAVADDWRAFQARAVEGNTFFAASTYYTYLTRRPA